VARRGVRFRLFDMQKFGLKLILAACLAAPVAGPVPGRAQQSADGAQQFAELGACKLVSGRQIDHCRLGYRTWGRLNADRSNAVLFSTWFGGVSANLSGAVGANALVDPAKYFVIVVDALGDGVSSSPSNSTTQRGPDFPALTIQDMVNAEHRLVTETLGLKHLHAVMGISMGGQQTFEWMVDYPEFMDEAIPIVGSPRPDSRDLLLYRTSIDAVKADPAWQQGRYTKRPAASDAELIWQLNLTTPANYERTHTAAQFDADYAKYRSSGILPFDANDWLAQLDAIVHLDVSHGGSMEDAAKRVRAKVLVVNSAQDQMVNPKPALDFARLIGAKTLVLQGDCGHLAPGCEAATLDPVVRDFLDGR
jgi:homoserine O-acetyltransferase/O-succinyltransferase